MEVDVPKMNSPPLIELLPSPEREPERGPEPEREPEPEPEAAHDPEPKLAVGSGDNPRDGENLILNRVREVICTLFRTQETLLSVHDDPAQTYFTVASLLVYLYCVAWGFGPVLSEVEWLKFVVALPMQAREVIPKMLWDGTLQASNYTLCNVSCGGLLNLHLCHLIRAQKWVMLPRREPPVFRWESLAATLSDELTEQAKYVARETEAKIQECYKSLPGFLQAVDIFEVNNTRLPGPRLLRVARERAGWDKDALHLGPVCTRLDPTSIEVGLWYDTFVPSQFGEEMFDVMGLEPMEVRVRTIKVCMDTFLPHDELLMEISKKVGKVWDHLHPTDECMAWLENRYAVESSTYFGQNLSDKFCKERQMNLNPYRDRIRGSGRTPSVCIPCARGSNNDTSRQFRANLAR